MTPLAGPPGPPTDRVPVAFVGGMGRSGSTLISRVLGAVPGFVSVGELHYLWDQGVRANRLCGCGVAFLDCPFWTDVGTTAFGGWAELDAAGAQALRKRVARNRFVPLLARPGLSSAFARDLREYATLMGRVQRAIHEVSGGAVVVDTSKYPSSAYVLRHVPDTDVRVVHLIRSSYGVAYSWTKSVRRPDHERRMARFPPARVAAEWTAYNAMYDGLAALGVPTLRLRYEDFVAEPRTQLRRIVEFLGRAAQDTDLGFLSAEGVELPRDHSVAGNPMRFRSGPEPITLDEQWRSALPRGSRLVVGALTAPGLLRYGYRVDGRRRRD